MLGMASLIYELNSSKHVFYVWPGFISILLFSLAACSNVAYLLVLVGVMIVIACALIVFTDYSSNTTKDYVQTIVRYFMIISPSVPFLIYLTIPIHAIRSAGLFTEGGKTGFFTDTVASLIHGTAHDISSLKYIVITILKIWVPFITIAFVRMLAGLYKFKKISGLL